jgi:hypothetical protein
MGRAAWWLTVGAAASLAAGCSSDAGASRFITILLTNVAPQFMAVDATGITWWERQGSGDGRVERVPKMDVAAARIDVLGPGFQPVTVRGVVYTTTTDTTSISLVRYTGPDQATTIVTLPGYGSRIAADDTNVYFSSFDFPTYTTRIWAYPLDGSPLRMLAEDAHGQPFPLIVDRGEVYWTADTTRSNVPEPGVGCVMLKVSTAGGAATVVNSSRFLIDSLALDAGRVYFIANDDDQHAPHSTTLFSSGRQGGDVVQLASFDRAMSLAVDDANLYWTEPLAGRVRQMPKTGGPIVTLAQVKAPNALALDATSIYWSTWTLTSETTSEGAIMMTPKVAPPL